MHIIWLTSPYSQSYGFSTNHLWVWELDHKEGWALKNWCFWTEVLENILESPLGFKEIKPINPKGKQPWIFIGRTDAEAEAPLLWPTDAKNWLIGKDPDARKDWGQEEKGVTENEIVGWHHWMEMSLNKLRQIVMDKKRRRAAVQVAMNCTWLERKWKRKSLSHVQLFATPWPIQSMEFSRLEYWSDLSLLQGIVLSPGLNPGLPHCRWILCHLSHNGNPKIME